MDSGQEMGASFNPRNLHHRRARYTINTTCTQQTRALGGLRKEQIIQAQRGDTAEKNLKTTGIYAERGETDSTYPNAEEASPCWGATHFSTVDILGRAAGSRSISCRAISRSFVRSTE